MEMRLPAANEILAVRASGKRRVEGDGIALLGNYLAEMDALVRFVDALEK